MMPKIVSVVGARPEFIQVWPISLALNGRFEEVLVHTGQHYDQAMSGQIFDELGLPIPAYNLGVGSGTHAYQLAEMILRLEKVLLDEAPELVIVRGDTNSTLAGAIVANKLHIPVAHIEAGERSYNRDMPEEINRIATDAITDLHYCASKKAVNQLSAEGIRDSVIWTGDVMYDSFLKMQPIAQKHSQILDRLNLSRGSFALVTLHRAANIDNLDRLRAIIKILNMVGEPIVFPVHPRTRKAIADLQHTISSNVQIIGPVGYLDMLELERNARVIATDSGGVQREAYFHKVPCLTLREETEWGETVEAGWNHVVGIDPATVAKIWSEINPPEEHPPLFGDGRAAEAIVHHIEGWFSAVGPSS